MNFLHNMSAPPRSSFTLGGEAVAAKTRVFCFVWALAQKVHSAGSPSPKDSTKRGSKAKKESSSWNWEKRGIPGIGRKLPDSLPQLAQRLRTVYATPGELFEKIGQPVTPRWSVDFLIGYRVRYEDLHSQIRPFHPVFCKNPLLCAGILSRCAGALFLSRRVPVLSWDTLLDLPIAFDDSLVTFR